MSGGFRCGEKTKEEAEERGTAAGLCGTAAEAAAARAGKVVAVPLLVVVLMMMAIMMIVVVVVVVVVVVAGGWWSTRIRLTSGRVRSRKGRLTGTGSPVWARGRRFKADARLSRVMRGPCSPAEQSEGWNKRETWFYSRSVKRSAWDFDGFAVKTGQGVRGGAQWLYRGRHRG
jgi:hypothetical protein